MSAAGDQGGERRGDAAAEARDALRQRSPCTGQDLLHLQQMCPVVGGGGGALLVCAAAKNAQVQAWSVGALK